MVAYVFWHTPAEGTDSETYEATLATFHQALSDAPPTGFLESAVYRHYALPWAPSSLFVYEDWYLVDSFGALGALNEAALDASRRGAHDAAARLSSWGAGGVYAPHDGEERPQRAVSYTYWLDRPEGMGYEAFSDRVGAPARGMMWRRQMVLGPAPEFCVLADTRLELGALDVLESAARMVYRSARNDPDDGRNRG